jgi:hypothetical protein
VGTRSRIGKPVPKTAKSFQHQERLYLLDSHQRAVERLGVTNIDRKDVPLIGQRRFAFFIIAPLKCRQNQKIPAEQSLFYMAQVMKAVEASDSDVEAFIKNIEIVA